MNYSQLVLVLGLSIFSGYATFAQTPKLAEVSSDVLLFCDSFSKSNPPCLKEVEPKPQYGYTPVDAEIYIRESILAPANADRVYFQNGTSTTLISQIDTTKAYCGLGTYGLGVDRVIQAKQHIKFAFQTSTGNPVTAFYIWIEGQRWKFLSESPQHDDDIGTAIVCHTDLTSSDLNDRVPSVGFLKKHLGSQRITVLTSQPKN